jgi:ankyrin repeat protein
MKYLKLFERKEKDALKDKLIDNIAFGNEEEFDILLYKRFFKNKSFHNLQTINFVNDDNFTPLTYAVYHERIEILKKLIKFGANVNYPNSNGETPLMVAATENNLDMLRILTDNGADWNKRDISGNDFFDCLFDAEYEQILIEEYPKKYEDYIIKKDARKYNL